MKFRGKFIAFEGLDGSGKTTQLSMLGQRFSERGLPCRLEREPSGSPVGSLVRSVIRKELTVTHETLALLFAADRIEHIAAVMPELEHGTTVLCDRYFFSSLAYQSTELPMERVTAFNSAAIENLIPDLTVFVDVEPIDCIKRINRARAGTELFEDINRLTAVRKNFFQAFEGFKDRANIVIINGNRDEQSVFRDICAEVDKLYLL